MNEQVRAGNENGNSRASLIITLVLLSIIGVAIGVLIKLYEREPPSPAVLNDISLFGLNKEISIMVTDGGSGLRDVRVFLVQDNKRIKLYENSFARGDSFFHPGPNRFQKTFTVDTRPLRFIDGRADLLVMARDFSWWNWMEGNTIEKTYPVILDTKPPVAQVVDSPRYIIPGGSGVIVYRVNEPVVKNGVYLNGLYYPGFPAERRGEGTYAACIGVPYDFSKINEAAVTVVDRAGNTGKAAFGMILRKVAFKKDTINISDGFLNMKVPEFNQHYPEQTGTPLERYLYVNNQVRTENNRRISEICRTTMPERLWQGRFKRMARSSRRAGFADHRTYYYQGRKIDRQVHLGIDLASVRHAKVEAANRGKVVFAGYLGIYGNTVIMDHGQGIFSLYAHLSQITAAKDTILDKGAELGLTGNTGMAGGDHLHFSVLVNGIFVNPLEWWDDKWLQAHILDLL